MRPKLQLVFPNDDDTLKHDFTVGCAQGTHPTSQILNRLCVCAAGYEFVVADRSCSEKILWKYCLFSRKKKRLVLIEKIEPKEYREFYEYGLCTHVDSYDSTIAQNAVCPELLTCEKRKDKHVCSCGIDKFLQLGTSSECGK